MELEHRADGGFVLARLGNRELAALRSIRADADPSGVQAAEFRLYPDPVIGAAEPGLVEDWSNYVEPDLRNAFSEAVSVVERDIRAAGQDVGEGGAGSDDDDGGWGIDDDGDDAAEEAGESGNGQGSNSLRIEVPADHRDAWCSALNQARLVMHERYRFPESDSPSSIVEVLTRGLAEEFGRSRFYAGLLEWIVSTYRL